MGKLCKRICDLHIELIKMRFQSHVETRPSLGWMEVFGRVKDAESARAASFAARILLPTLSMHLFSRYDRNMSKVYYGMYNFIVILQYLTHGGLINYQAYQSCQCRRTGRNQPGWSTSDG